MVLNYTRSITFEDCLNHYRALVQQPSQTQNEGQRKQEEEQVFLTLWLILILSFRQSKEASLLLLSFLSVLAPQLC